MNRLLVWARNHASFEAWRREMKLSTRHAFYYSPHMHPDKARGLRADTLAIVRIDSVYAPEDHSAILDLYISLGAKEINRSEEIRAWIAEAS